MDNRTLDKFGKILMEEVRDESIERYRTIIEQKSKSPRLIELSDRIKKLSSKELALVDEIVIEVIDNMLFNLLNTFEEKEEKIKLFYYEDEIIPYDIVKLSDGLAGELFTEDGWIYKYSKFRYFDYKK